MTIDKIRKSLTKEKPDYDIEGVDYRLMLDSPHGQKVLAHMLYDCYFIEEIETPEEVARRNTLVRILHYAGILKEENLTLLAQKLLEVARVAKK